MNYCFFKFIFFKLVVHLTELYAKTFYAIIDVIVKINAIVKKSQSTEFILGIDW